MERKIIDLPGYDIMATAACDFGNVVVLNNNSSHYLVVETEDGGSDLDGSGRHTTLYHPKGTLIGSYQYEGIPDDPQAERNLTTHGAYKLALEHMLRRALECCESLKEADRDSDPDEHDIDAQMAERDAQLYSEFGNAGYYGQRNRL